MTPDSRPTDVKPGVLEYGFWAFLIVAIGRVGDLIGLGSFPLAKIALALPLVIRVVRWKQLPRLAAPTRPLARTAILLVVLAVLLTPGSIGQGRSAIFLTQEVPVLLASASIAYVMSRTWRTVRGTLLALVLSGLILARSAVSGYGGGRAFTATMYDPNDLAYLLVTMLPLALGFVMTAATKVVRMIYVGIVFILLVALLLTQSRGGLLGLIAVAACIVFVPIRAPEKNIGGTPNKRRSRIPVLLGVACVSVIVWSQLPQDARERFATVLDLSHDYNLDPNDPTARGQIWSRGIRATIDWPIGYGPQTFPMVDWKYGGRFNAPHNSYLQIAVELGVAGFVLFLTMYILTWRGLQRARATLIARGNLSLEQQQLAIFARLLQFSLVGNAVAGFFLSMAYATVLWTIFGISMAVMAAAAQDSTSGALQRESQEDRECAIP
jgi:O-antigen ligase